MTPHDSGSPAANRLFHPTISDETDIEPASMDQVRAEFLTFFDAEYHPVVQFIMRDGANLHDAQDAAQEAFLQAWTLLHRPDEWKKIRDRRGWIRVVALNLYRRPPGPRRRLAPVPVAEVPDLPQHGDDHSELTAQTLAVMAALHTLDDEARAVMAFQFDGFTSTAISDHLGISDQRVRDVLKRGRRSLARTLTGSMNRNGGGTR
jgi:RNA polymerase sigma factor (sigma-70 family)